MKIRMIEERDIHAVLDIYKPYIETTAITFETEIPSYETFAQRVKHKLEQFPWLVYEDEGKIVGYAYASLMRERAAYEWDAELSVYLHEDSHGQGIGSKLYRVLEAILYEMNYVNLYGCITYPNEKSVKLHQKFGYKEIGIFHNSGYKLGRWHDVLWMEKQIRPLNHPEKTKTIHEIDKNKLKYLLNQSMTIY